MKNIVLGVTGGIAAYKALDIISTLKKQDFNIDVIMTENASKFVTPLSFQTLSQNYVVCKMFDEIKSFDIEHISLAKKADLILVAPATANIIGKVRAGICDDSLTTTIMAAKCPVLFAPAMNTNMYQNKILQENIKFLKELGYGFIEPDCGRLACGDVGSGKLAAVSDILEVIYETVSYPKDLSGKKILITAGPTIEPLDPVRFITNHSSGKMGFELARAAKRRGAQVTLISGPVSLEPLKNIKTIYVNTALEMKKAVFENLANDIIIKSAAVGDYRPKNISGHKIKKSGSFLELELEKNPDILKELGCVKKEGQVLVGFCMETEKLEEYAMLKLKEKNLDIIVANSLTREGAGFKSDTNIVTVIDKNNKTEKIPMMLKSDLAHLILDKAKEILVNL